jgi:ribosome modulation factor
MSDLLKDIVVYVLYLDSCQYFYPKTPSRILTGVEIYVISGYFSIHIFGDISSIPTKPEFYNRIIHVLITEGVMEIIEQCNDPYLAMTESYQQKYQASIQGKSNEVSIPNEILLERKAFLNGMMPGFNWRKLSENRYSKMIRQIEEIAKNTKIKSYQINIQISNEPWFEEAIKNVPKCQVDSFIQIIKESEVEDHFDSRKEIKQNIVMQLSCGRMCNFCKAIGENMNRCSKCHLVCYCNTTCQSNDWRIRNHRKWCCNNNAPLDHFAKKLSLMKLPYPI